MWSVPAPPWRLADHGDVVRGEDLNPTIVYGQELHGSIKRLLGGGTSFVAADQVGALHRKWCRSTTGIHKNVTSPGNSEVLIVVSYTADVPSLCGQEQISSETKLHIMRMVHHTGNLGRWQFWRCARPYERYETTPPGMWRALTASFRLTLCCLRDAGCAGKRMPPPRPLRATSASEHPPCFLPGMSRRPEPARSAHAFSRLP